MPATSETDTDGTPLTLPPGELDPNGGDHPAVLVAPKEAAQAFRTVDPVMAGDLGFRRTVNDVSRVRASVIVPSTVTDVAPQSRRVSPFGRNARTS